MFRTLRIDEEVPIRGRFEVVVAGGGVGGVAAALAARRAGRKVLLLEKSNLLGGLATIGLINYFEPLCNGRGVKVMAAMTEELLRLAIRHGFDTLPEAWRDGGAGQPTDQRYVTRYSPQIFALELLDLLLAEGVEILLDCVASTPLMRDGQCLGVVTESKSGREFIEADIVVDATGDADLLARAGVPTVQGRNFFSYIVHAATLESAQKAMDSGKINDLYVRLNPGPADLSGNRHPEGMRHFLGTTVDDVTEYLATAQRKLLGQLRDDPAETRMRREVVTLPTMPQFRTTRRLDGDYTLTESDVYRHFDDSIGAVGDFRKRDDLYEIPWRTLTRTDFDNFIAVGRIASGEGGAWDVLRVIPPAILTGQAAGIGAALALESAQPVHAVDMGELQRRLAAAGVRIHFDDAWIPQERR